jgi:hypothetical protein
MLMLSLDDAAKVAEQLIANDETDSEIIRQEIAQKCWIAPTEDKAAEELSGLICDINPAEICCQIESDNLKGWCGTMQVNMTMAMAKLPCWVGKGKDI